MFDGILMNDENFDVQEHLVSTVSCGGDLGEICVAHTKAISIVTRECFLALR